MKTIEVIDKREIFGMEFNIYGTWEEPLFLAKDIAEFIKHSNVSKMLNTVDEEERVLQTCEVTNSYISSKARNTQKMWFLTEYGVYEVLMQSRQPIAREFKQEIKGILKDIRLKGYYIHDQIKDEQIKELNTKLDKSIRNRWKFGLSSYNFSELAKMCGMKVSDMKDFLVTHNICYMDITTIRVTEEWKPYFDNQNRATIQGAGMIFDMVQNGKVKNI